MSRPVTAFAILLLVASQAVAQYPLRDVADGVEIRFATSQPVVSYTLRVDTADLSGFDVEIRIRNAPDTLRLAMVAHPEYDDRYWRFLRDVGVEAGGANATVTREDNALWRIVAPGGESLVHCRFRLPPQETPIRQAWGPFLAPSGGLVGGPHSFLYVVGATLAPAHVRLELPAGWEVATGLEPTADPRTFFAPSVAVLVDSPILIGRLRRWSFAVDDVPHHIVYWPLPDAQPFDTTALVDGLARLVRQAIALFGRAPYREYTFQIQDGAAGSLEHWNSVSIGAPSAQLARGLTGFFAEAAHEYVHTWNLMRIHPAEYGDVDYRPGRRSRGLWWSEGITMMYADLLLRRGGLAVLDSTRVAHLEGLIARYLASPGNARFAPESVSVVTYGTPPGSLGDYSASVHLQGELLGTMLDLMVRDATGGRRSLDDVMRAMLARFAGERGFSGSDIDRTVAEVCGCAVRAFFDRSVRTGNPIDFDRYLSLAGWRLRVSWAPAVSRDGAPVPDLRMFAWLPPGERALSLLVSNPASVWGRAGLHTGDRLVSLNGTPVSAMTEFRAVMGAVRAGDTVTVVVTRPGGPFRASVAVTGLERPTVRIEELPAATERQRALRSRWVSGVP